MPRRKMTNEQIIVSFWKRVEKTEYCWNWLGSTTKKGYGRFYTNTQPNLRAHIFSYITSYGPTDGKLVCHTCDNRKCVRPDHLFLGDEIDNSTDMVVKNRSAYGEKHYLSQLSDKEVNEIRMLHKTGWPNSKLVKKFHSTSATISRIINNKTRYRLPKLPIPNLVNPTDEDKISWVNENRMYLRSLLQYYGTEYRRKQNPNYWTNQLSEKLMNDKLMVVSDVRLPDEMKVIQDIGGEVWLVVRDGIENVGIKNHATEHGLVGVEFDRVIENNGTLDDLESMVDSLFP